MKKISSLEQLEQHYGKPSERALWKEINFLSPHYIAFIEASPFALLSTQGEKGIDCSPRGDPAGFTRVVDNKHLLIPDRRGNNRLDSMRNIVVNNQVGLLFLIPGIGETIRVSGTAEILIEPELCESFSINGKAATSVLRVTVEKAYFQCQKALVRSQLWVNTTKVDRGELPSAGEMVKYFAELKSEEFDDVAYDRDYPEHMSKTIY